MTLPLVPLALLGGHHVDSARYKGHLLAPAHRALRFLGLMLGDALGAFELLPAFSRNEIDRSAWTQIQQMSAGGSLWPVVNLGKRSLKYWCHIQRLVMPEDAQLLL